LRIFSFSAARARPLHAAFLALAGAAAAQQPAAAATTVYDLNYEFIRNGGFEQTSEGQRFSDNGAGTLYQRTNAVDWTYTLGKNSNDWGGAFGMLLTPEKVGPGAYASGYDHTLLGIWSPDNGVDNGFVLSPQGGNFIALDGPYYTGYLKQEITGLVVGQTYNLSFDWAAAQFNNTRGATTQSYTFGFIDQKLSGATRTISNPDQGFSGWESFNFSFVATATNDVLYFMARGAPGGAPPATLLDNVSLKGAYPVAAVPEPGTWAMMIMGFGFVGWTMRRRKQAPARA